jgi:hypothetical protein
LAPGRTPTTVLDDLPGVEYTEVLSRLHAVLRPATYFEIGTLAGQSLALASCASIAVDPDYGFVEPSLLSSIFGKPSLALYRMASDAFFASHDPAALLGAPIDMAFLDGMHRCEFLLRDFANTERFCRRNSVVILHDCLPVEAVIASRTHFAEAPYETAQAHRGNWWTGDVWRTALLLKRVRPDLRIGAFDARPSGLIIVTNLDPSNTELTRDYARHVDAMLSWRLEDMGLDALLLELGVESTDALATDERITARYWL